jgi:pre-mRNA-splicing factor ATP-dependent RNA helicase DHX16
MICKCIIHLYSVSLAIANLVLSSGFLDDHENITSDGRRAANIPVDPVWYRAICEAVKFNCSYEMIAIAALSSTQQSIFLRPFALKRVSDEAMTQFYHPLSDHMTYLNALYAYVNARNENADMVEVCLILNIMCLL